MYVYIRFQHYYKKNLNLLSNQNEKYLIILALAIIKNFEWSHLSRERERKERQVLWFNQMILFIVMTHHIWKV